MKKRYRIGQQIVEIDGDATRRWYAGAQAWDCSCVNCQNFLALARARALPAEILSLLDELGIPAEKATYVCMLEEDDGRLWYDFSYRVAGRIIEGEEEHTRGDISCYHEIYPFGAPDFPEPHFDLGFHRLLSWVLE